MIDGHGDDLHRYAGMIRANFSSNIPQHIDHSALIAHLASMPQLISSYPEPEPSALESVIASAEGVSSESIMVTNGATEAIYMIAAMLSDRISVSLQPTFSEYRDACLRYRPDHVCISSLSALPDAPASVWICNPNNPTGSVIPADYLMSVIMAHRPSVFVIDCAYRHYSAQRSLPASYFAAADNAIGIFSMTKDYCMPGLRIGYLVAKPDTVARLREMRMPWSVSSPAIEAAKYMFSHRAHWQWPIHEMLAQSALLATAIADAGYEVTPSQTPYFIFRTPRGTSARLKQYLATEHGLLVRDASNFIGLDDRCVRVCSQTPLENQILINALRSWMKYC